MLQIVDLLYRYIKSDPLGYLLYYVLGYILCRLGLQLSGQQVPPGDFSAQVVIQSYLVHSKVDGSSVHMWGAPDCLTEGVFIDRVAAPEFEKEI